MATAFLKRGTFLLRAAGAAAAAAALMMQGASAQGLGDKLWDLYPGRMMSCSFASDEVDWYGTITLIRPIKCETPKVVHIMDNSAVLVRSNDVLATSNVHFVVHHNAKLVLAAKNAIVLDRHESSELPLFTIFGEVVLKAPGWSTAFGEGGSSEDRGGVIRMEEGALLASEHDVRYSPNAIMVANAAAMSRKDADGTTTTPIATISTTTAPGIPTPPTSTTASTTATSPTSLTSTTSTSPTGTTPATTPSIPTSTTTIPSPMSPTATSPIRNAPATRYPTATNSRDNDDADSVRRADFDHADKGTRSPAPTPAEQGNTADPPPRDEAPGGPEPEASAPNGEDDDQEEGVGRELSNGDLLSPLKVGDVLRGELKSASGKSAIWPAGDGAVVIGRGPEGSPSPDDLSSRASPSKWSKVATLLKPNYGKVREALRLRGKVTKEAEEQVEGVSQAGGGGGTGKGRRAVFGWRRRVEREELERARQKLGEVDVTIDDRACLKVTIDGTPVVARSGKFRWEFLNRFPWRRPRDDGYEVHMVDTGIEVQLRGRTVWGITAEELLD